MSDFAIFRLSLRPSGSAAFGCVSPATGVIDPAPRGNMLCCPDGKPLLSPHNKVTLVIPFFTCCPKFSTMLQKERPGEQMFCKFWFKEFLKVEPKPLPNPSEKITEFVFKGSELEERCGVCAECVELLNGCGE
ncbi:hypothetical protein ACJJTC_001042 [Scirpophaga incertulas]